MAETTRQRAARFRGVRERGDVARLRAQVDAIPAQVEAACLEVAEAMLPPPMLNAVEVCRTGMQCCHACPQMDCGDNMRAFDVRRAWLNSRAKAALEVKP